jgi:hypothetical protein
VELEPFLNELRGLVDQMPDAEVVVVLDCEGSTVEGSVLEARPLLRIEVDRPRAQVYFLTEIGSESAGPSPALKLGDLLRRLEADALPRDEALWVSEGKGARLVAELVGIGVDEESGRVGLLREPLRARPLGQDEWGRPMPTPRTEPVLLPRPRLDT